MANNMYDAVRKTPPPKRDRKLWIAGALAALFLVVTITPMLWSVIQRNEFRRFTTDLAITSTFVRRKGSATLEIDGETFSLEAVNYYESFIRRVTSAGPGRKGDAPDEPPLAVLRFSSGVMLELWSVELDGYVTTGRTEGTFLRYTYRDGKTYSYDNELLPPTIMVRLLKQSIAETE